MINELLKELNSLGIPALIDLISDISFIICVPFFIAGIIAFLYLVYTKGDKNERNF